MNLQVQNLAVIENTADYKSYRRGLYKLAGGIIEGERIDPVHNRGVGYRLNIKME